MSYVRMNYFEYISEEAGDELEAHYIKMLLKIFRMQPHLFFSEQV